MYLITNNFFKKINDKKLRKKILNKCCNFSEILLKKEKQIRSLPKGFWVKKIINTEIFKFRLNSGDRVLFTYIDNDKNDKRTILFLEFCKHDNQIRKGNSITKKFENIKAKELEIDKNYKEDDEINKEYLDEYIKYDYSNLENAISMVVEKEYINKLCEDNNEDYIYYLTQNQLDILKDTRSPILVTGAAGSGKTTVAMHKIKSLENACKIGYITKTQLLCEKVKNMYNKFSKNENVEFLFLNKFYSKTLSININNIAKFEDFKEIATPIKKLQFKGLKHVDIMDIYVEYRGILKGYLGPEGKEIKNIFNRKNNMISMDSYLSIPKDYSIFSEHEKIEIYNLCCKYYSKLSEYSLIDPLDLPIEILKNKKIKLFDYLIVDEIQDLNEIEIYMLGQLVKNKNQIMFCGDVHQTVNPTFFDIGRLRNIYYGQDKEVNLHILDKNYRNPIQIINILNKLARDRQKYMGKTKYDYIEVGVINGGNVHINSLDKMDLKTLIESICKKHYCAIIVANEFQKSKLINEFEDARDRIFTVNEIKGLEYDNIYCFNMISANSSQWNKIYLENVKSYSKYRYYFNSLYVALSRAKKNLYIFEEDINNCVINSLKEAVFVKYEQINDFNEEELNLNKTSSKDDWIKEYKRLEKVGQISKAKFARNKAEEQKIIDLNKHSDKYIVTAYNIENLQLMDISNDDNEVSKLLNEGFNYYQQRHYVKSLEYYEKALELDGDNFKIYHCIANSFGYMTGGMEKSIEYFNESLRLNPKNFLASLDKAAIESNLDRTEDAINTLKNALKYNSNILNIYTQLVDQYMILYEKNYFNSINNTKCLNYIIRYCELGLKSTKTVKWDGVNKIWKDDINSEKELFLKSNLKAIHYNSRIAKNNRNLKDVFIKKVINYNH